MQQAAPVCCADPRGPEHTQTLSTGLPSPPRTPPGSQEPPDGEHAAREATQPASAPLATSGRWPPSPTFTRAEIPLTALAALLLAILTTWPLVLHMGSRIAPDLAFPVRTAWQI